MSFHSRHFNFMVNVLVGVAAFFICVELQLVPSFGQTHGTQKFFPEQEPGDSAVPSELAISFRYCPSGQLLKVNQAEPGEYSGAEDISGFWMAETELSQKSYDQIVKNSPGLEMFDKEVKWSLPSLSKLRNRGEEIHRDNGDRFHRLFPEDNIDESSDDALKRGKYPVFGLTALEAVQVALALELQDPLNKSGDGIVTRSYRLPTIGEWQYACRGLKGMDDEGRDIEQLRHFAAWPKMAKDFLDEDNAPTLIFSDLRGIERRLLQGTVKDLLKTNGVTKTQEGLVAFILRMNLADKKRLRTDVSDDDLPFGSLNDFADLPERLSVVFFLRQLLREGLRSRDAMNCSEKYTKGVYNRLEDKKLYTPQYLQPTDHVTRIIREDGNEELLPPFDNHWNIRHMHGNVQEWCLTRVEETLPNVNKLPDAILPRECLAKNQQDGIPILQPSINPLLDDSKTLHLAGGSSFHPRWASYLIWAPKEVDTKEIADDILKSAAKSAAGVRLVVIERFRNGWRHLVRQKSRSKKSEWFAQQSGAFKGFPKDSNDVRFFRFYESFVVNPKAPQAQSVAVSGVAAEQMDSINQEYFKLLGKMMKSESQTNKRLPDP